MALIKILKIKPYNSCSNYYFLKRVLVNLFLLAFFILVKYNFSSNYIQFEVSRCKKDRTVGNESQTFKRLLNQIELLQNWDTSQNAVFSKYNTTFFVHNLKIIFAAVFINNVFFLPPWNLSILSQYWNINALKIPFKFF